MATRRLRSRAQINADQASHPTSASSRPRRAAAAPTSATIERTSPEESRQSIHLTVKAAPSKLREATSGNSSHPRRTAGVNSRDSFVGGEIVVGQRSSRNKKTIVEETSEEELDEDELGDDDVEEDDDEDEEMADDDDDDDDDDADADADEDVDMEDSLPAPPPPAVKAKGKQQQKPSIKVSQAEREVPSVEAKEMAMEDDQSEDEELSELESDEPEDEEGEEEDAEGEEDDLDDELDSDEETPLSGSRAGTPDLSKLTRRQRAAFETYEGELIALSNEAQKKKHLTAEEHAMRRAEMARRRKNLSEKRNEEEKMDTINRLLKKQAPKRRGKAQVDADGAGEDDIDYERASPLYIRYIQTAENSQIAVPHEWLESPLGELMAKSKPATVKTPFSGRMVQEVA